MLSPRQISDDTERAVSEAFRNPIVLKGALDYLQGRKKDLDDKVNTAARRALYAEDAKVAALTAIGALTEVERMLEIVQRWTE